VNFYFSIANGDISSEIAIRLYWSNFSVPTRELLYQVGGKEENRNPVIEALLINFNATGIILPHDKPVHSVDFAANLSTIIYAPQLFDDVVPMNNPTSDSMS
jgi:hypothetical protein